MKRLIFVIVTFAWVPIMVMAQNPEGRGYIEPRFILGSGVGNIHSDWMNRQFDSKIRPFDFGFGFRVLSPMAGDMAFTLDAKAVFSKFNWEEIEEDRITKLSLEMGIRFYLK